MGPATARLTRREDRSCRNSDEAPPKPLAIRLGNRKFEDAGRIAGLEVLRTHRRERDRAPKHAGNPSSYSGESANYRFLGGAAASAVCPNRSNRRSLGPPSTPSGVLRVRCRSSSCVWLAQGTDLLGSSAGPQLTLAAHNGVARRFGTAKVSSRTNLSRNLRPSASTTIRSR